MNLIEEYIAARDKQIEKNIYNHNLNITTARYTEELVRTNYTRNFTWMGIPILQYPGDLMVLQELIWQIKPNYIIETGVAFGGGMIFYASILESIGMGKVLGIDIDPREENMKILELHPLSHRIYIVRGSSTDKKVVEAARYYCKLGKVMVCLDSLHTYDHVLQELKLYSPLVSVGSYIIVFDTAIEFYGHLDKNQERPWGKGNNPWTAVQKFMDSNNEFVVDREVEMRAGITAAPGGWLKRIQ